MNEENVERPQILRELIACQSRVKELERLETREKEEVEGVKAIFETMFELSPDALIVVNREGNIVRLNVQAEKLFGYSRADLIGKNHDVLVPDRYCARHTSEMESYMKKPQLRVMGIGLEMWGRRRDGSEFPVDIDLGPLDTGKESLTLSVIRDVTPRKKLEDDLLDSEKRYRDLVELSPDAVLVTSEGKIVFVNPSGVRLFGSKAEDELVSEPLVKYIHPDDRNAAIERMNLVEQGKMAPLVEQKIVRSDGKEVYVETVSMPFNFSGHQAALSIARDVTERRLAERARKENEESYRRTLDTMLEGCQIIGFDWRYMYVNDAGAAQARATKQKLLGRTLMEQFPGIEKTPLFERLKECMEKRVLERLDSEITFPDGGKGWFQLSIQPVPEGIFMLSIDITERKKLENELSMYRQRLEQVVATRTGELANTNERLSLELKEHEKLEAGLRLRATILDNAAEAIFLLNAKGDFVYVNEAALAMYGHTRGEFLSMNIRRLLPPKDESLVEERLKKVLSQRHLEVDALHIRKDGTELPVQVRHSLIRTAHGEFIVSVIRALPGAPGA